MQRMLQGRSGLEERLQFARDPACLSLGSSFLRTTVASQVVAFFERLLADKPPVLVYGDYDVDGSISSLLIHRWLRTLNVPGNYFLPSRFRHGYGLDASVMAQAGEQGYKTLIALDCGTTNIAEVQIAREQGLDVLIIDHHSPGEVLPDALLLNPHLEEVLPPYCTAGLVHEMLCGLERELKVSAMQGDETELAGLATLADVVPLEPRNWLLASRALALIPESTNLGLSELVKVSGLHGLTRITERQIGFSLGPRLNAAGRMKNARIVVELLSAGDSASARQFATILDGLNNERKDTARQVTAEALLQASTMPDLSALALYAPSWHVGVLGITAARVAEHQKKPAAVMSDAPGDGGLISGSVRSYGGVNLVEALAACRDNLVSFGGHAQAAGIKLLPEQLADFRYAWSAAVSGNQAKASPKSSGDYPEVALHEFSAEFEEDVWRLAPFGADFAAPRCVLKKCQVSRVSYMGRDKLHLNIVVHDGSREMRIAAFDSSHLFQRLAPGSEFSALVEIEADNWNNVLGMSVRLIELR